MPFPKRRKPVNPNISKAKLARDEAIAQMAEERAKRKISEREIIERKSSAQARAAMTEAKARQEMLAAKQAYLARKSNPTVDPATIIGDGRKFRGAVNIAQPPKEEKKAFKPLAASQLQRLRALVSERIARRREALKVWRAMPIQEAFERSRAKERIVYGSNRSGKTTAAAVEFARMVLGVHELSGKTLPLNDGIACVVGYDYSHIGRVNYRKLFKKGAFRVIRDRETGEPRAYEPDGRDADVPLNQTEPSPPLIPKRFIAPNGVKWKMKKSSVPESIKLTNGWEIRFFSSEAKPPQGDEVNLFWFDEEIEDESWYEEASRALMARGGYFIWSATPHVGGDDLIDLHSRAEKLKGDANPMTEEFLLLLLDNLYLANRDKQELIQKYKDKPEAYRTRILGEFAAKRFKVYPEYDPQRIHGFDMSDLPGGRIPDDWCRYVAIDPGLQIQAALFMAVPPPHYAGRKRWYVYDEIYLDHVSVPEFARAFEAKTRGQNFEAWILDMRAGRVTSTGNDRPIEQIYRESIQKVRIKLSAEASNQIDKMIEEEEKRRAEAVQGIPLRRRPKRVKRKLTESERDKVEIINFCERVNQRMFIPGADNPKAGVTAVKDALAIDSATDSSQVVFARGLLPNLDMEMSKYHHKRIKGKLTDEFTTKDNHLCDCLRYLVTYKPEWKKPNPPQRKLTGAARRLRDKRARLEDARENVVNFGPASSRSLRAG